MRYKKEKKRKGKEKGKEYLIPDTTYYDSPMEEEMDDNFSMQEIDEYDRFTEDDKLAASERFMEDDIYPDDERFTDSERFTEDDIYPPDEINGYDEQINLEHTMVFDGAIVVDEAQGPVDAEGVVINERDGNNSGEPTNDANADLGNSEEGLNNPNAANEIGINALEERRSKKTRKRKNYTLRILVGMVCIAGVYLLLTSKLFNIEDISVVNNNHYTAEQIVEMSGIQTETNMFETRMTPIEKTLENDSYIKNATIKRKPFHKVEIILEEREEKYCILSEEKYVIADFEGVVLSITDEMPPLTVIDNLKIKEAEIGSVIKTESNLVFSEIISFLIEVEKNDMYFKQIEASDVTVKAYLTDIFLCKGSIKNLENDISQVKRVIHDLGEKQIGRGTIIVTGNGSCTYNPEI